MTHMEMRSGTSSAGFMVERWEFWSRQVNTCNKVKFCITVAVITCIWGKMFPEILGQNLRRPTPNLQSPHEGHPDLLPCKMLIRRKLSLVLPCTSALPGISSILPVGAEQQLLLCEQWKWCTAPAKSPVQEVQHCRVKRFPVYLLEELTHHDTE